MKIIHLIPDELKPEIHYMQKSQSGREYSNSIFRIIFHTCSVYFLIMGAGLLSVPQFLLKGLAGAAKIIEIILDVSSVLMGEYQVSYAMINLPVEALSLTGILLIWEKNQILL